jgi:hypothetical protein
MLETTACVCTCEDKYEVRGEVGGLRVVRKRDLNVRITFHE